MYAVFDTETTGISPKLRHRIVEVAVVLTDDSGRLQQTWSTLLNPDRDLGPQHIHGISAREVCEAPKFGDIAAQLVELMEGRTLVAHNLPFDLAFLASEFERVGQSLPVNHELGVCTMNWSRSFLEGASRSLPECCTAAGISLTGWHSALSDATATSELLAHYISQSRGRVPWSDRLKPSRSVTWPRFPRQKIPVVNRTSTPRDSKPDTGFVGNLVDYLPRVDSTEAADPYLAVLDEALSDRYLSADEIAALRVLAESLQLHGPQITALHEDYLAALARIALMDDQLSIEEETDLRHVADMLGLPAGAADAALHAARSRGGTMPSGSELPIGPGDMIVFTGATVEPRQVWLQRAAEHGFVPHNAVTKKVKLIVAADPDSLSGKAKKARGYNIPIMALDDFRKALGYPRPGASETPPDNDYFFNEHRWIKQNHRG